MKQTPTGTAVGVDNPFRHVEGCDHLTDDGRCRFAIERAHEAPRFAFERELDGYSCVVAEDTSSWEDCEHFCDRTRDQTCIRCGLEERPNAHRPDRRPLLEEHHLSYASDEDLGHEITVSLCRWCHAKVHQSWARIDDDVSPDPEAIAELERRRGEEANEGGFKTAAAHREDS